MATQNNNNQHDHKPWDYSFLSLVVSIIFVLFLIGVIAGFMYYIYKQLT